MPDIVLRFMDIVSLNLHSNHEVSTIILLVL